MDNFQDIKPQKLAIHLTQLLLFKPLANEAMVKLKFKNQSLGYVEVFCSPTCIKRPAIT